MKKVAKIICMALAVAMCVSLTACGGNKSGVINVHDKQVTVGYTDYAPMNYTENGVLKGFDTELAVRVFNALGYEVRFKLIDWSNKYIELDGGTVDCLWNGFTANTADDDGIQRSDKVDFSYYYMNNAQCIVRKATSADLTDPSQFAGKSVSYEEGSAAESFISGTITVDINKRAVTSQMDAIRNVNMGTADYAIVDVLLAESIVGTGDYSGLAINEGIEIDDEYYAIGFKKGSELTAKVNAMLEAFAKTGYLAELATKYGVQNAVITDFSEQA